MTALNDLIDPTPQLPNFWVYILQCVNGDFYTGYAKDLIQRYQSHASGAAAKCTRSFPPRYLAQAWPIFGSKGQAMQIENFIKKLKRNEKLMLIDNPDCLEKMIMDCS